MSLRVALSLLTVALAAMIWLVLDPPGPEAPSPQGAPAVTIEAAPLAAPPVEGGAIHTAPFEPPPPADPGAPAPAVLELCFLDALDQPVADVEAAVLPEDTDDAGPRMPQDADALGRIRWELPAGRWRWTTLSAHHVEMEPRAERFQALTLPERRGAWKVVDTAVAARSTSGSIELESGRTVTLRIRVHRGSRVRGTLITATPNPSWTQLSLFLLQRLDHPQGPEHSLHLREQIAEATADAAGAFVFNDLPPGRYQLAAAWRCADEICFARRGFSLEDLEDADLGAIPPDPGSSVLLELGIEDDDGPLAMESLFGPLPTPLTATVALGRWQPETAEEVFSVVFEAELGRTLTLAGLRPGEWDVHAVIDPVWPPHRGSLSRPEGSPRFSIPGTGSLRHAWRYHGAPELARLDLEIVHAGEDPPPCCWALLPEGSGAGRRGTTSPSAWEGDRQRISLALEPDRYHVLVHTQRVHSVGSSRANPGLQAYRAIEVVPGRQSATLLLEPGATLRGEARSPGGAPLADCTLAFRPTGLPHRGAWLYSVRTDQRGRFRLAGLLPGRTLEALGVTGTIDPDRSLQPATLVVDRP